MLIYSQVRVLRHSAAVDIGVLMMPYRPHEETAATLSTTHHAMVVCTVYALAWRLCAYTITTAMI